MSRKGVWHSTGKSFLSYLYQVTPYLVSFTPSISLLRYLLFRYNTGLNYIFTLLNEPW
jgi:hypothetical protein